MAVCIAKGDSLRCIINLHGAHEDQFVSSLVDLARLIRRVPRAYPISVQGDFNVDLLLGCGNDPWKDLPDRPQRHVMERVHLSNFLDVHKLCLVTDVVPLGAPPATSAFLDGLTPRLHFHAHAHGFADWKAVVA